MLRNVTTVLAALRKTAVLTLAATVALAGVVVFAKELAERMQEQTVSPPAATERFEVVSIRQSMPDSNVPPGGRGGVGGGPGGCKGGAPQVDPGRIGFSNNSLYTLIAWAHGLDCLDAKATGLISGGPEWVGSDQWVIQATIPAAAGLNVPVGLQLPPPGRAPISDPKLQRMLQNLLADRFNLTLNRETREVPVYALTVAKGGPKLQHPEDVPCTPINPRNPGAPRKEGEKPKCMMQFRLSMADFPAALRLLLDRPVIDKTGITGIFEFRLVWAFDPTAGPAGGPGIGPLDPSGPSIFTALQEQLGLKLESSKGPVEVLVIDSVSKPTQN
jgi:uncharacterized protein (TIGR03435 family)